MPETTGTQTPGLTADATDSGAKRPGRKRDRSIDDRLMWAALVCYSRDGWAGFNFDAIAREAKVGKPAIYRRWASPEELLGGAAATLSRGFLATDHGRLRDDITSWATSLFEWWESPVGWAFARMQIEMRYQPALRHIHADLVARPLAAAARQMLRRAMARGEIPETANIGLLLEIINGAVYTHAVTAPPKKGDSSSRERYIARLTELVFAGAWIDRAQLPFN